MNTNADEKKAREFTCAAEEIADLIAFSTKTFDYVDEHRAGVEAFTKLKEFMVPKIEKIFERHAVKLTTGKVVMAGDVPAEEEKVRFALVLEFPGPEEVREAMAAGACRCTVFGAEV